MIALNSFFVFRSSQTHTQADMDALPCEVADHVISFLRANMRHCDAVDFSRMRAINKTCKMASEVELARAGYRSFKHFACQRQQKCAFCLRPTGQTMFCGMFCHQACLSHSLVPVHSLFLADESENEEEDNGFVIESHHEWGAFVRYSHSTDTREARERLQKLSFHEREERLGYTLEHSLRAGFHQCIFLRWNAVWPAVMSLDNL
jgi:hypothetical protein